MRRPVAPWPCAARREAHDYRYFPEPDLPPLQVSDAWVDEVRVAVPELPEARRSRLMTTHGLTRAQAVQLTQVRPGLAAYFEELVVAIGQVKPALNWTLGEVNRKMNELGTDDVEVVRARLLPTALAELLGLVERGIVNGTVAKEMFEKMYATGDAAEAIVEREGPGADRRRGRAGGGHPRRVDGARGRGRAVPIGQGRRAELPRGTGHASDPREGEPEARPHAATDGDRGLVSCPSRSQHIFRTGPPGCSCAGRRTRLGHTFPMCSLVAPC